MAETVETTKSEAPKFVDLDNRSLAAAALIGLGVGILIWLVSWFFQHVIFNSLICHSSAATCADNGNIAFNIAAVLMAVVGVVALVRSGIYRPVLVALGAVITLWSLQDLLQGMQWFEALAWTGGLYALAYALFAWILKVYNITISVILLIVVVIAARIAIAI